MATCQRLPDELREWVESRAAEDGVDPQRVLSRAVIVHREAERLAAAGERPGAVDIADRLDRVDELESEVQSVADRLDRVDELESEVQSVADRLDRVDDAVDTLGDETEDLVADVRERVIQVKREADAKAPADHDHADLRERVETAEAAAESAANAAETVEERADSVGETVERLSTRQDTLAGAVVDVRDRVEQLQRDERARAAAEDLRRAANRNGDAAAACAACGETVDLALLTRPRCPHCEEEIVSFESSGLIRGATLSTGDRPALTGETPLDDPLEDAVGE
ncbi:MAG: hypothetical protein A07HB70_02441 [uncultured archaeon A07HB70]|nr:MAG: hypothetical protein A07HB70_02441 [uncultured archaeon A07HB70]